MTNNTDFIKWMCEKAEGFSIEPRYYPDGFGTVYKEEHEQITDEYKESLSWEILLQRAIEGVNRNKSDYEIDQYCDMLEISNDGLTQGCMLFHKGIDQAKESALRYIWENETK